MLEARIRKSYPEIVKKYFPNKEDLVLSLKHVLNCSIYNQGCDGGYAYLVLKFFNEFELLHKNCYDENSESCEKKCKDDKLNKLKFTTKKYKYVGGSYGKCSEKFIMEELAKNGPLVISFEPDYSFMFYKKGVYVSPNNNWYANGLQRPEWIKVDHSVVVTGFGEEVIDGKVVKFWTLQNSWGKHWGENGNFRMLRGIDHLGIESICESAIPVVIEK